MLLGAPFYSNYSHTGIMSHRKEQLLTRSGHPEEFLGYTTSALAPTVSVSLVLPLRPPPSPTAHLDPLQNSIRPLPDTSHFLMLPVTLPPWPTCNAAIKGSLHPAKRGSVCRAVPYRVHLMSSTRPRGSSDSTASASGPDRGQAEPGICGLEIFDELGLAR